MELVVVLKYKDAAEISQIVKEIKDQGLKINVDFDFEYSPGRWDSFTGDIPKQTKFTFYNKEYGLLFALRYGDQ